MIKYFCDRCGKEIDPSDVRLKPTDYGEYAAKNVDFRVDFSNRNTDCTVSSREEYEMYKSIPNLLCDDCKMDFVKWCKSEKENDNG